MANRSFFLLSMVAILTLLHACSSVSNDFLIVDSDHSVTEARLHLCGADRPLVRHGNNFRLSFNIRCEGEGEIIVTLSDGSSLSCKIGYVTPGARQKFDFIIENRRCD